MNSIIVILIKKYKSGIPTNFKIYKKQSKSEFNDRVSNPLKTGFN